jgi:hypothetical protein
MPASASAKEFPEGAKKTSSSSTEVELQELRSLVQSLVEKNEELEGKINAASTPKGPAPAPSLPKPKPANGKNAKIDALLPALDEVLHGGGHPGVTYAYILSTNQLKAQAKGYAMCPRAESFPVGEEQIPVVVMQKGTPVRGASALPLLMVDVDVNRYITPSS